MVNKSYPVWRRSACGWCHQRAPESIQRCGTLARWTPAGFALCAMNKQQVHSVLIAAGHINDVTHPVHNCGSHRNGLDIPYTSQWAAAI